MPREKMYYRDQVRDIIEYFNGKHLDSVLTLDEVSEYLGVSIKPIKNRITLSNAEGITVKDLAKQICD